MAYIDTGEFYQHWHSIDTGRDAFITEWLKDTIVEIFLEESPFARRIAKGKTMNTLAPKWQTQRGYPRSILGQVTDAGGGNYQVTFSGKFNGRTLTADLLKQLVKKGTILQKVVSGVRKQVMVNATPSTLTVAVVAYGNTGAVSVDTAAAEYSLGAPSWADTRSFEQPTTLPRDIENTFTQLFRWETQMTETDEDLKEDLIDDPFQRQVEMILRNSAREKAWAFINGIPVWDSGTSTWLTGYQTNEPRMAGLLWWAWKAYQDDANTNIYKNINGQPPSDVLLKNVAHALALQEFMNISSSETVVMGHPTTLRWFENMEGQYIQTSKDDSVIGFEKKEILLEGQPCKFLGDREMPEEILAIVNPGEFSHGPWGRGVHRKPIESDDWVKRVMGKEHIWGLMPENKRWIGLIENVQRFSLTA